MGVKEVIDNLQKLQTVLAEKYSLEKKIAEAPEQLSNQKEYLARLNKEFIERDTECQEVRAAVEHLRAELAEAESLRESGEKGMDNITTHREYEALDKQISEAKEREDELRKELQRKEKVLADLEEQLKLAEATRENQQETLATLEASIDKEVQAYEEERAEKEKQEAEIAPLIEAEDKELVYKFQRIIKRNTDGVVPVRNSVCTGCHMLLPAQFANEVRSGEKTLFCPYCSRILFYQEVAEDEVEDYSVSDEAGSLADFDDDDDYGEGELADGEDVEGIETEEDSF